MEILSNSRIVIDGITYVIIKDINKYIKHLEAVNSPIKKVSGRTFIRVNSNISIGVPLSDDKLKIVAKGGYLDITNSANIHPAAPSYVKRLNPV